MSTLSPFHVVDGGDDGSDGGFSPLPHSRGYVAASETDPDFRHHPKPRGQWRDGICDWTNNLYPSCFCACCSCYGYYLIAQMAEKSGCGKFSTMIYFGVALYIFCIILQILYPLVSVLAWISFIVTVIFATLLRLHIIRREGIPSDFFPDLFIGLFCHWCSVAQMARHIYGYMKQLDGDGMIDRPDQYLHDSAAFEV